MKKIKRNFSFVKGVLFDKERKSIFRIVKDLRKMQPGNNYLNFSNYFQSLMYKKYATDLENYFDGELMHKIILSFNKKGKHPILENKIKFAHLMIENNIPIAPYIGCIKSGSLITKNNKTYNLSAVDKITSFINQWLEEYKTLFIKPIKTSGGAGILRLQLDDVVDLSEIHLNTDYIIEQGLVQHRELDKINLNCINSLRVMSYKDNEEVYIPSCVLRVGIGASFVDNSSAGGVFVNYDLRKNELGERAYSFVGSGGKCYTSHPDTQYTFKGKSLPYPEKVDSIIKRAAQLFPDVDLIGWDIGFTEDGPVILEGNSNPSFQLPQISLKGLNQNIIYKKHVEGLKEFDL